MIVPCPLCGKPVVVGGLGRKRLNHSVKNVYDAIERMGSITGASRQLGCSRAYIYKILEANGIRLKEIINGEQEG